MSLERVFQMLAIFTVKDEEGESNELCYEKVFKLWVVKDNENVIQDIHERMYLVLGKGGMRNVKVFAVLNETMTVKKNMTKI